MKKRKVIIITFIIIFTIAIFSLKNNETSMSITEVLNTKHYSYLPTTAQEYIKTVYEDTGEILKTEKNKVANEPYLNPKYVVYLSKTPEEQKEYNVIPDETIIDYVYSETTKLNAEEIPASFDLRNVEEKNFVTPIKNQGGLGLCWAFATNAQIESLLLIQNNKSADADVSIFSERQIDYATANDGIIDGKPDYSYGRILGDGGTFKYATSVMADSLGLADTSWKVYDDDDYEAMEKKDVYSFTNSKYEVSNTVTYPVLNLSTLDPTSETDQQLRENYLNNLKSLIMKYGGAYIATGDPISRCSVSINGSRFLYDDNKCASSAHAMQVIGWDDNFKYNICIGTKDASGYYHINKNVDACTGGTVVNGKGAWLIKNSWGNTAPYLYIAYDSYGSTFGITTNLEQKTWDNYYSSTNSLYTMKSSSVINSYIKKSKYKEQLTKIKFSVSSQNATYQVYVSKDNSQNYELYETITGEFPGLYTVDLTEHNIYLEDEMFSVHIIASAGKVSTSFSIYTNNIESIPEITTTDSTYDNSLTNIDKYSLRIASTTVGIPELSETDYKILDSSRQEIKYTYTKEANSVFANQIFTRIYIDKNLPKGTYTVQTIYNGEVLSESQIIIDKDVVTIEGEGTTDNPYIIRTPAQLGLMKYDGFAFYELANDIDLTYDTTNKDGLFYNEGKGWEPIKYSNISYGNEAIYGSTGFTGGLNGNNHKIIGLNINRPDEAVIGLFAIVYNMNFSNLQIKNIVLEEPNITGYNFVGGIAGHVNGSTYERCLTVANIAINGGSITGNNYVGGIVGYLRAGSYMKNYYTSGERHLINNLYNSATINANNYAGGLFGLVTNITGYKEGNSVFQITNLLNKGKIISKSQAGGIIGKIKTQQNNYIKVSNSINTGNVSGKTCSAAIVCKLDSASVGELKLSNIYYLDETGIDLSNNYVVTDNVTSKSIDELKDSNSYTIWTDFSNYWKLETINEINRLPILSSFSFEYTKLNELPTFVVGTEESFNDYISPKYDAAKNINYIVEDESILTINNGIINPIKKGTTKITLESNYDGYNKEIEVEVISTVIIESTTYNIEETDKTIYVSSPTELSKFFNNISGSKGYIQKEGQKITSGYIGTGMMIDGYTIVLKGDVTGDGQIRVNDIMKISKYTVEGTGISESYNIKAADVIKDGHIKVNDIMKISKYTVEGGEL